MSEGTGSPTLTLRVTAKEALATFSAMTAGAKELRAALLDLNALNKGNAKATNSSLTILKAEVGELRQALKASQLQYEALEASIIKQTQAAVKATAEELAAVKAAERAKREETKETDRVKKQADAEASAAAKARQREQELLIKGAFTDAESTRKALAENEALNKKRLAQQTAAQAEGRALNEAGNRAQQLAAIRQQDQALRENEVFNKRQAAREAKQQEELRRLNEMGYRATQVEIARLQEQALRENEIFNKRRAAQELKQQEAMRALNETGYRKQQLDLITAHEAALREDATFNKRRERLRLAAQAEQERATSGVGRSAIRGLAAAGGGTFLTYGASIPALAGAFALAASTKEIVKVGSEFDYQMKFIGALTQETDAQIKQLSESVLNLARNTPYGPIELAKGMRVLEQAGIGAHDALKMLPTVTGVALQGETDLTSAAETLVGVMNEFKLTIKNIEHIGDAMSAIASKTPSSLGQLSQAMRQVTGLSDRFNVSLETTLALTGMLAQQKIVGGAAGTITRRFIEESYTPRSANAKALMKYLGLDAFDKNGELKQDITYVEELIAKLRTLKERDQKVALSVLYDERSIKLASMLVADLNGEMQKLRETALNANGSVKKFAEEVNSSVTKEWAKVWSNFQVLAEEAFERIKPGLVGLAKFMQGLTAKDDKKPYLGLFGESMKAEEEAKIKKAVQKGSFSERSVGSDYGEVGSFKGPIDAIKAKAAIEEANKKASSGKDGLPRRFMDPEALQNDISYWKQRETNIVSSNRRENQIIEASAKGRLAVLDAQHKYQLISEQEYTNQFEAIDRERSSQAIALAENTVAALIVQRDRLKEAIKSKAEVEAATTKIEEAKALAEALKAESARADKIRAIRIEGEAKERERKSAAAGAEARENIAKLQEQGELLRKKERETIEGALVGGSGQAEQAARIAVEEKWLQEKYRLTKMIEELKAKGDEHSLQEAAMIPGRLSDLKKDLDIELAIAAASARANYERERQFDYGWQQAFVSYAKNAQNAAQTARDAFNTTAKAMEDAIVNFTKTGKLNFKDFAKSVIDDLIRIKAREVVTSALSLVNVGSLSRLFGFGSNSPAGKMIGDFPATPATAVVAHTGGVLGSDTFATRGSFHAMFSGASRFHTGGLIGNEVPVIAQRGEGVFTPAQMRALAPATKGGDQINIAVTVNSNGTVAAQGGPADQKQLGEAIGAAVRNEIMQQQRPGGLLNRRT